MRQTVYQTTKDDRAQMLLATGVVLLLSLLSMAVFSVKVAGLTSAHEANSDSVIETTKEVLNELPSLAENRTELWINGGLDRLEATDIAMESIHDDLLSNIYKQRNSNFASCFKGCKFKCIGGCIPFNSGFGILYF